MATGTYPLSCVALKYLQIVHCPLCPFQWQACWLRVCLPIGFFLPILINILPALPIKCGTFLLLLLFALFFVCLFVFNFGLSCLLGWSKVSSKVPILFLLVICSQSWIFSVVFPEPIFPTSPIILVMPFCLQCGDCRMRVSSHIL